MSEQKYYVKLRPEIVYPSSYDGFESMVYTNFWLDKLGIFVSTINRDKITKSELAKIMDGALYTQTLSKDCIPPDHVYYGSGEEIVSEWINPLIELIPVEEVEK